MIFLKYDAVVLAGSPNDGALKECSTAESEALIKIGQKYMVEYVLDALLSSGMIDQIVVAGSNEQLKSVGGPRVGYTSGGATVIDTLEQGISALGTWAPVLVVSSDIPLLTREAIEDFINACETSQADLYYPIISQTVVESRFPNTKRTYVNLVDGVFTGGNLVLIKPEALQKCAALARAAVELRKKPVKLCQLLGVRVLLKYFLGKLTLTEVETRVSELLGITSKAVISRYPEIGVDVDKPVDLELVLSTLEETA